LTKTQRFIEDNQKALLIGCGVLAVSGAGYYLYNRNGSPLGGSDDGNKAGGSSSSASKKKKKNKKKGGSGLQSGFLKGDGADGPLVEEIEKPKPKATEGVEGEKQESGTSHLADVPEAGALAAMSEAVSRSPR
jgi:import receptor subunit TOM70